MARILIIASYTPSLVNFRGPLIQRFLSMGHEVVACSPGGDPDTEESLARMGVDHHCFRLNRSGANPIADLATYRDIRTIIRRTAPSTVLSYTIKPVIYGSLAAGALKVPHIHAIISGLGTSFQTGGLTTEVRKRLVMHLYRRALSACDRVMFQNRDDRSLFLDLGLTTEAKAMLTDGSGIDLDRFPAVPQPEGPPRFLLIARLIHEKGVGVYAEAARIVKRDLPDATFRIVGFFEDHPDAISRDEMSGWVDDQTIEFEGPLDDVREELAACSIYCLPSYYREGVPRSILEALATGRPIITTDAPGCRETVDPGVNGWLVPPRDAGALADAMIDSWAQRKRLAEMGAASRLLAESRFDVDKVNDAICGFMRL